MKTKPASLLDEAHVQNDAKRERLAYPAYRDTGIRWLPRLPSRWQTKRLKHTTYVKGRIGWQNLRFDEFVDDGPYCVTGTDFEDGEIQWRRSYHVSDERHAEDPHIQLRSGDLLITKDGSIGKVALVGQLPGPACLNSGLFLTRSLRGDYSNAFMYWVLASDVFTHFIDYMKSGSTIQHLYQNVFVEFSYPLPPLDEQRAIAAFLDRETARIDALIANKQRLIELLQEKRTALISHVVTKGLNPHAPMKPSGIEWLGAVPHNWRVQRLKYAFLFLNNRRIPLSAVERADMERTYPYYGASGIIDHVDSYLFDEPLILIAEDGANLFSRSTPLAFVATGRYWVNNHAHILKPRYGSLAFWEALLQTVQYDPWISGSAQPKLTKENLGSILLPIPPEGEIAAIAEHIARENGRISPLVASTTNGIDRLREYRSALISAAVTGKIDVRGCVPPPTEGEDSNGDL